MTTPPANRPIVSDQNARFHQALWFHHQGRLAEAERIYREIVQRQPHNASAVHMLGLVALQTQRLDRAVKLIGRAVALAPDNADALINLGLALHEARRFADAIATFDRAIALSPEAAEAHTNRGLALEALARPEEALASHDKAIGLRPGFAEAHNHRGNALRSLRRFEEALAAHARAIALNPGFAVAHHNHGNLLRDLNRLSEALSSYDKAIALAADHADTHNNRGAVLLQLQRPQEALASCDKAIALRPGLAAAHHNRGNVLCALGRLDDALASFDRAIALQPGNAEVHNDRAVVLDLLRRHEEAWAGFRTATSLRADYAEAWTNHAICLLRTGRLAEGWRLYEWRKQRLGLHRSYRQPLWLGEQDITGKTLFVHWEQGLGDTLHFLRYARLAAGLGARVIMEVQPPLLRLLAQLGPAVEVIGPEQCRADFDYYCSLLSLPLAFGTELDTIPSARPYLQADEMLRARWSTLPLPKSRFRIGVAWSGNPGHLRDAGRSIDLAIFRALFEIDAEWICLQREIRAGDRLLLEGLRQVTWFGDELGDFADTAGLFDLMDLVITVDTSVAHLAASMGKPVWLLLSYDSDWRWMLDRDDSPWYPTMRLFRQRTLGDWDDVLRQVGHELHSMLAHQR